MAEKLSHEAGGTSNGTISALDITPDDCTLAHLASIIESDGDVAPDTWTRLESVEITDGSGTVVAVGCIACRAKIQFSGGVEDEPKGAGLCAAPFAERARAIVTPKTVARNKRIVDEAVLRSRS